MSKAVYHGAKVHDPLSVVGSVPIVDTAVSCFWVTAPEVDDDKFPINKPVVISNPEILQYIGDAGTLKDSVQGALGSGPIKNVEN